MPPVIYSIPPSSPLHYVTYVQIYNATPQYVVVGYTPGYFGTVVASGGVVVYGTGYAYASYIGATVWYPPPVTYGYGAAVLDAVDRLGRRFRLWPGLRRRDRALALLLGLLPGALLGRAVRVRTTVRHGAHGGGAVWGPSGWAATSGNVYHAGERRGR